MLISARLSRHVAIKISVSDQLDDHHEAQILKKMANGPASHPGKKHIIQLLDRFEYEGPNGTHQCLVLEPLGPNVLSKAESCTSHRLPGLIAWEASRQTIQALAYVHANGIAHGGGLYLSPCQGPLAHLLDANWRAPLDLHPGNILFANTATSYLSVIDLPGTLGKPQIGDVVASYGYSLTAQIPKYLVRPTCLPSGVRDIKSCQVKLVDFGQAFLLGQQRQVNCPLVFRAPEAVLTSHRDLKADVWSLGCTVLHLVYIILRLPLIYGIDIRADRRTPSFRYIHA